MWSNDQSEVGSTKFADAGSIAQTGIELAAGFRRTVDANGQSELVGLRVTSAGFRTFPQGFEAVLRR